MKPLIFSLLASLALVACKPSADMYSVGPMITTPTQTYLDSTYASLYGSKAIGLPASTVFIPRKDDGVRLVSVIENEKFHNDFSYDSQNRLIESKRISGQYTLWSSRYFYEGDLITRIEHWVNIASGNGFETISSNVQNLQSTTYWKYDQDRGVVITSTSPSVSNNNSFFTTGLDKNGRSLWMEINNYSVNVTPKLQVKKAGTSYLYQRDDTGNILRSISTYLGVNPYALTTDFVYDTNHNPYSTLNWSPGEEPNQSNVIKSIAIDEKMKTTTTYTYDYRPDGYPSRVVSKIISETPGGTSESSTTNLFVYNK